MSLTFGFQEKLERKYLYEYDRVITMAWALPTTGNFYKFCSTFGLIIMIGPATAVTILSLYTTDMFEKVELLTTTLQADMSQQESLSGRIEKNPPGSTLIENNKVLIRERAANLISLNEELTRQNVNLGKAKSGLRYLTIAIFPTVILYGIGAAIAFFGYKNRYKKPQIA
jgi:hypothetical protein